MISETQNLDHQDPEKEALDLAEDGIAKKGYEMKILYFGVIISQY